MQRPDLIEIKPVDRSKEALQTLVEFAKLYPDVDGVMILGIRNGQPILVASSLSGYEKSYLVTFLTSWFTKWFNLENLK